MSKVLLVLVALAGCTSSPPSPGPGLADTTDKQLESAKVAAVALDESSVVPDPARSDPVGGSAEGPIKRPVAVLDSEVLATVLDDLPPTDHDAKLTTFARKAASYPQTVEDVLFRYEKERWTKLTDGQIKAFNEAAKQLVGRIKDAVVFEKFNSQTERIRILEVEADESGQPSDRGRDNRPVQAWPPGYSNDQRFAVVRLVVPWSIHHADVTYLLAYEDGKWTVCLRQTVHYF